MQNEERERFLEQNAFERVNISIVIIKGKPSQRNINILIFPRERETFDFSKTT